MKEPALLQPIFHAFEHADPFHGCKFGELGLAIRKALVEMHNGTIAAHSQGRGKGATFSIELPLTASAGQAVVAEKMEFPHRNVQSLRILLVEDHGVSAKMISQVLMAEGHNVEIAGDVADALKAAEK